MISQDYLGLFSPLAAVPIGACVAKSEIQELGPMDVMHREEESRHLTERFSILVPVLDEIADETLTLDELVKASATRDSFLVDLSVRKIKALVAHAETLDVATLMIFRSTDLRKQDDCLEDFMKKTLLRAAKIVALAESIDYEFHMF